MLGTPAVLLYNGFLVGGKKWWAKATLSRRLNNTDLKRPTLES